MSTSKPLNSRNPTPLGSTDITTRTGSRQPNNATNMMQFDARVVPKLFPLGEMA